VTVEGTSTAPQVVHDVFVPTHGRLDLTTSCIEALYRNTRNPFHLIVTDTEDPQSDLTSIFLQGVASRYPNVTYIHKRNPDFKTGNEFFNVAFQHAQTDYISTVMNSMRVEPDWDIVPLQLMQQNPDVGIIGFKSLFAPGIPGIKGDYIESAGIAMSGYTPIDIGRDEPGHRLCGVNDLEACQWAFAMLRKQAVVGNLEEDAFYGHVGWDDIDNCFAVKKKGWRILYCGVAAGYHSPRATRGNNGAVAAAKNMVNSHLFYKRNGFWDLFLRTCPDDTVRQQVDLLKAVAPALKDDEQKKMTDDLNELVEGLKAVKRL
jgi:GT2 family glycosyltransferase